MHERNKNTIKMQTRKQAIISIKTSIIKYMKNLENKGFFMCFYVDFFTKKCYNFYSRKCGNYEHRFN